jgi:hypothetical protein
MSLPSDHVLGVFVPSTTPLFFAVLAVHVPAGLTCVVSGATAALTRKGSHRHITAGRIYTAAVWVVFATALLLAGLRWPHDLHLAAIGAVAFVAALVGRAARRRHWPGDRAHILGMGVSYVALLTAFYVDNGPHLALWQRLPSIIFWVAPTLIGAVIIRRALTRPRMQPDPVEAQRPVPRRS